VIHVPARDPFQVFGLTRTLDIDERALEARYLKLSRESHPDLHRSKETGDCIAVLQRAAEVNDAWKILRDPWQRAKLLLELESPGALERNKKLDPGFLAEALDLAEEVALARADDVPALRQRLQATLEADFAQLREEFGKRAFDAAARRLHACHYHQKALRDLDAR
jgi:molecular chaperone HscB